MKKDVTSCLLFTKRYTLGSRNREKEMNRPSDGWLDSRSPRNTSQLILFWPFATCIRMCPITMFDDLSQQSLYFLQDGVVIIPKAGSKGI